MNEPTKTWTNKQENQPLKTVKLGIKETVTFLNIGTCRCNRCLQKTCMRPSLNAERVVDERREWRCNSHSATIHRHLWQAKETNDIITKWRDFHHDAWCKYVSAMLHHLNVVMAYISFCHHCDLLQHLLSSAFSTEKAEWWKSMPPPVILSIPSMTSWAARCMGSWHQCSASKQVAVATIPIYS